MDENLKVALSVAEKLGALEVRWFLGGSLASSMHGVPRATLDADIVADLRPRHVRPFLDSLGADWYVDEHAVREAIAGRSSFNLIHMDSAMKVDVFVPKLRRFEGGQFSRAHPTAVSDEASLMVPVCSAEDIISVKLEWFRLGLEVSERQWTDIIGVLRAKAGHLDLDLLRQNAVELRVSDLLEKAMNEAGIVS